MTARRSSLFGALIWVLGWGVPIPAAVADTTPTATADVPGTTLEAQARDDDTSVAPWLIGSGVAAAAAVVVGGTILRRRMP